MVSHPNATCNIVIYIYCSHQRTPYLLENHLFNMNLALHDCDEAAEFVKYCD